MLKLVSVFMFYLEKSVKSNQILEAELYKELKTFLKQPKDLIHVRIKVTCTWQTRLKGKEQASFYLKIKGT